MPNKHPSRFLSPTVLPCDTPPTLECTLANLPPAQQNNALPPAPLPSMQTAIARPPPRPSSEHQMFFLYAQETRSVRCAAVRSAVAALRPSHCRIHKPWPPALSTSTRQILDTSEAAAALPSPTPPPTKHATRPSPYIFALGTLAPADHHDPHTRRVSLMS
ncbi:hypothetical protein B0H14DRAFT_3443154 [Mycena olivaceomarginata]|nr:hypothetical protein B0H14DRAFT_3443154 [Mycena olivaceomarginata]